jgi:hypothetical protein
LAAAGLGAALPPKRDNPAEAGLSMRVTRISAQPPNPGGFGGAVGSPGEFWPGVEPNPGGFGARTGAPGSFLPGVLPNPGGFGAFMGSPGMRRPGR